MKIYPITTLREHYRGSVESKRPKAGSFNAESQRLERYLNDRIAADPAPVQGYLYASLSREVGISETDLRKMIGVLHNGFEVAKSAEAARRWQGSLSHRAKEGE